MRDTVLATPNARAAEVNVQRKVAGRSYGGDGPICDSLNAIANREDPIVKVDISHAPPSPVR